MFRTSRAVRSGALRSAAALAGFLVVAGCSADAVAPRAPRAPSALRSDDPGTGVVPNRIKYRDSGLKPATGRAGSAALTARALVDKAGTTELELTTGALDEVAAADVASGTLTKVQVKGFAPDGSLLFTDNYNSTTAAADYDYGGLIRGARVEVQANVRTPGSPRVEVITLGETVKLRPDVVVGAPVAPSHAHMNTPINVTAVVREVNGDVGARADCVLYVDGAAADHADGIWVDAGGLVTCAFTHGFAEPGMHRLEVRAENIAPRDYEPANNIGAAGQIEITSDPYRTDAYARDLQTSYSLSSTTRVTRLSDGRTTEGGSSTGGSGREQSSGLYAEMDRAVTFPLTHVEVSQSTGGILLHQATYDGVVANASDGTCFSQQYTANGRGRLFLCTSAAKTTIQYARWAGDVSYYSESYSRTWNAAGAVVGTPVYSWNTSASVGGTIVPFAGDLTIHLRVDDGGGVYNTVVEVPLQPYLYQVDSPMTCTVRATSTVKLTACSETHWLDQGMVGTRRDWGP